MPWQRNKGGTTSTAHTAVKHTDTDTGGDLWDTESWSRLWQRRWTEWTEWARGDGMPRLSAAAAAVWLLPLSLKHFISHPRTLTLTSPQIQIQLQIQQQLQIQIQILRIYVGVCWAQHARISLNARESCKWLSVTQNSPKTPNPQTQLSRKIPYEKPLLVALV